MQAVQTVILQRFSTTTAKKSTKDGTVSLTIRKIGVCCVTGLLSRLGFFVEYVVNAFVLLDNGKI